MLYALTAERTRDGESLRLTANENRWQVTAVDGLGLPEANISTYDVASLDGVRVNHIKMAERDITISLRINGDVDTNRNAINTLFRLKDVIRLHITTHSKQVYIDGYVRSAPCEYFSRGVMIDIELICPVPYFSDESSSTVTSMSTTALFEFPISINYDEPIPISEINPSRVANIYVNSENETGVYINIWFNSSASSITVNNQNTGEFMTVEYDFQMSDQLVICTIPGSKSITLIRNAAETNMIPYLTEESSWFELQAGDNNFDYIVDQDEELEYAEMEITYTPIYYAI